MFTRNLLKGIVIGSCISQGLLLGAPPDNAASLLKTLKDTCSTPFTLTVEVVRPTFFIFRGQGNTKLVMRMTIGDDKSAIVWKASELPEPAFFPLGTDGYKAVDYDPDGNLLLSMWSQGATILEATRHEEFLEGITYKVSPEGAITEMPSPTPLLERYYFDSGKKSREIGPIPIILCALGHVSPKNFDDLQNYEESPDGLHEFRITGHGPSDLGIGIWSLTVDRKSDNLIRKAEFGSVDDQPRLECSCEGMHRFGDVTFAERGKATEASRTMEVKLVSFSPGLDSGILEEARKIVDRAKSRDIQLLDYRDNRNQPQIRFVHAGTLDTPK